MKYVVKFAAHSGISFDHGEFDTRAEALEKVKQLNKRARKTGHEVVKLAKGEWEHCEPDDCAMVPDTAGILFIDEEYGPLCEECETELEEDGRCCLYCPSCDPNH